MIFSNYNEFFNAIRGFDLYQCPTLKFFIAAVNNIGVGCPCQKAARINLAVNKYIALATDLTEHEKSFLKDSEYGNVIVWASLFLGQPVAVMMYISAYLGDNQL